ncbi:MAG: fimbrillin family protein, partial [Bacteroidales bacterium]
ENDKKYLSAQIEYNATSWKYKNDLDKAYWPSGSLNFFAVAPYSDFYPAVPATGNTVRYFNTKDDKSMEITYTVPTETNKQQDLMYATTAPIKKPSEGKVQLNFKHALNQIHFMGRTDSKNLKVIINPSNGIQLCNVYGSAVGTVNQGDQSVIVWDYTSKKSDQVFTNVTPAKTPVVDIVINTTPINADAVILTKETDVLMLLPQPNTLLAWVPSSTTTPKTGSYLKISCKLIALAEDGTTELAYLHGTNEVFADMYVPFNCSAMAASGKKITYTLIFGGGYTDEGQPILTPITFDTAVQDWVNASSDVPTQTK